MDILFILLGIAIFFAAAAIFAIEHIEVNPAQAIVSFFIPPFAWWLYYSYWNKSRQTVFAQLVAGSLILGGSLLNVLFDSNQAQFTEKKQEVAVQQVESNYVGSDLSLKDLANAERNTASLNGRLAGKPVVFTGKDVAEFDENGDLRIKFGEGFHGHAEILIALNTIPTEENAENWVKTVRPDSPDAPVIYLSSLKEGSEFYSQKFESSYSMDMRLEHTEYNMFSAHLQLVLPDKSKSFLVGNFPLYSSRLRFHGEGLIKDHDSNETLEVIATQTLTNTYRKYVKGVLGYTGTSYDYSSGTGQGNTTVYVKDKESRIRAIDLTYYKNENGWFLDVKGLKDALKDRTLVVSSVPTRLKPALKVDLHNIGSTNVTKAADSLNVLSKSSQIEKEPKETQEQRQATQDDVAPQLPDEKVVPVKQATIPEVMQIDLANQQDNIETLLKPLIDKDVELLNTDGKAKTGVYVGVYRKQVVLETQVGGGVIEYLTEYEKVNTIKVLNRPDVRPQKVEFRKLEQ